MFIAKHKESINNKHLICMVLMVIELFLRCPRMEIRKGLVQLDLANPAVTKKKKMFISNSKVVIHFSHCQIGCTYSLQDCYQLTLFLTFSFISKCQIRFFLALLCVFQITSISVGNLVTTTYWVIFHGA